MDNLEFLKDLLKELVKDPEVIKPEATLKDLGIDSLDLVDVMLQAEEKLDIRFEDEELLGLKTVNDAVELLNKKTGKES